MSTLTIRLPEDTAQRLKQIARHRGMSVNKRVEEATQGDREQALGVLDRLEER